MEEQTKELTSNYLRTPGGTCCDGCGVLGKHYLIDEQPLLYRDKGKWLCGKCLGKEKREETVTIIRKVKLTDKRNIYAATPEGKEK